MSVPALEPLQESLSDRSNQLEEKHKLEKKRNQGDGSTPALWREADPNIRRDVVESCLNDLEEIEELDEFLKVVAEWQRNVNQEWEFKINNSRRENNRNDIKKAELRNWVDGLVDLIPESEFKTCGICGSNKMPESDRRRKTGYKWRCLDCSI